MGSRKDMGASPLKSPENSNKAAPASGSQEPPLSRYYLIKMYLFL